MALVETRVFFCERESHSFWVIRGRTAEFTDRLFK